MLAASVAARHRSPLPLCSLRSCPRTLQPCTRCPRDRPTRSTVILAAPQPPRAIQAASLHDPDALSVDDDRASAHQSSRSPGSPMTCTRAFSSDRRRSVVPTQHLHRRSSSPAVQQRQELTGLVARTDRRLPSFNPGPAASICWRQLRRCQGPLRTILVGHERRARQRASLADRVAHVASRVSLGCTAAWGTGLRVARRAM